MTDYSLKEMVENLDITYEYLAEEIKETPANQFLESLRLFVSTNLAKKLWADWNPELKKRTEDQLFIREFQEFLADGVSLGFRLTKFKELSKKITIPTAKRLDWISIFEEAVNECSIRVYLNREDYDNWLSSSNSYEEIAKSWTESMDLITDALFHELGLVFPPINFSVDKSLTSPYFRIEWNDLKLPPKRGITNDTVLVNDTVDRLTLLNIKGEEAINPANGSECAFISSQHKEIAEQAGLTTWDSSGYFILNLSAQIRKNAAAFVNRNFIDLLLYQLNQSVPETVTLINEKLDKDFLVQIIRGLLAEEISVQNLQYILDGLLSFQSMIYADSGKYIVFNTTNGIIYSDGSDFNELTPRPYIETLRHQLKRYISHKYTNGGNTLVVYLIDPEIEKRLVNKAELSTTEKSGLLEAVENEVGNLPPTAQNPVILTTVEVRFRLKQELQNKFPHLAVLSYQELSPDMNIQPIARISLD